MTVLYNNKVDGICGNDDCGQMSAWYVLSALGFYPVNPRLGRLRAGQSAGGSGHDPSRRQVFTRAARSRSSAENNSPKNLYIQSAMLNGKPLVRSWFTHAELVAGGELVLKMGPEPNKAWGQKADQRPPAVAP